MLDPERQGGTEIGSTLRIQSFDLFEGFTPTRATDSGTFRNRLGQAPPGIAGHGAYRVGEKLKECIDIERLPHGGERKRQDLKRGYQRTRILESLTRDIDGIERRVE